MIRKKMEMSINKHEDLDEEIISDEQDVSIEDGELR
jgi:hypothetical protein